MTEKMSTVLGRKISLLNMRKAIASGNGVLDANCCMKGVHLMQLTAITLRNIMLFYFSMLNICPLRQKHLNQLEKGGGG